MNNKQRLWQIFGPVICAFILLICVFLLPWGRTFSPQNIYRAAISQNNNIFRGQKMKQTALSKNYVPFYGSSELSRFDPLHPSVLAKKYQRSYQPFLLGGPGSQSLAQYFGMQETKQQMTGKRAVFIVSPQWFTKQGQIPAAMSLYFSQLQAIDFLLDAHDSVATRYAARRLLSMPAGSASDSTYQALLTLASGQKLSDEQVLWLKLRRRALLNEDTFFTTSGIKNREPIIDKNAALLPEKYNVAKLQQVANEQGKQNTSSNQFGINNNFYRHRLNAGKLAGLKNSQRDFDYEQSPEYSDFQLVLKEFARNHENVLFIIPPVNEKWSNYTGLSQTRYQAEVNKIKHQLVAQGFYNIADLSRDGGKKYFMQDTIHLGWNGWLAVDRYVKPFMSQPQVEQNYHIKNYYFTRNWQQRRNVKSIKIHYQSGLNQAGIKNILRQQGFVGSTLIVKDGKVLMNYNQGYANRANKTPMTKQTSFLINSVQKMPTSVLLMQQVRAGKVKLSDKIAKYYPDVPHGDHITLLDMLQMRSGLFLRPGTKLGTNEFKSDAAGIKEDIKNLTYIGKAYGKRVYSPVNYLVLCGVISKVSGRSYESLFKEQFIHKLNLRHTAFLWDKAADNINLATSYGYALNTKHDLQPTKLNIDEIHGELGAGSVAMSNEDLYKLVNALFTDKSLMTASERKTLWNDPTGHGAADRYYCGGFYDMDRFYESNGTGYNYSTFLRVSKDGRLVLIMQSNVPFKNYWTMRPAADQIMALAMNDETSKRQ
ncbi:MAG: D-alanyl-lipoteichoic acid biosynthesis protein DltD [Lactobacillus sp.]|jgi:D-alanyl-lipoteichoic acid biosynthesis protein DltD|nr:D-alanyl-lipoteichoic acid biosynthesis protein DltD [Lactobacillus sp.]MCI1973896.1 D-alanyl-lipoteichoic acid biosynthesis protein DltD [Lactobacillus sp.]